MTRKEFLLTKITETKDAIASGEEQLNTEYGQKPNVRANLHRFIAMAQGNLARYQQDGLNEGELYRLETENSPQGISDRRLFELHNGTGAIK